MTFQMQCLGKSLGGGKGELAEEAHHCLLSILHFFPRGKFHFLIWSIGGGFSRVLSTGNTALAFQNSSIVGRGERLTVPGTCIAVPAPPLVALYP